MRSATLVPVALSLALHACAVLALTHVGLPRGGPPVRHDPTIGLTILPTFQPATERPSAPASAEGVAPVELKPDGPAPASSSVGVAEVPASEATPQAAAQTDPNPVSAALPSQLSAAASGPVLAPLGPDAAVDPVAGAQTDAPPQDRVTDLPEKTVETATAAAIPDGLAAEMPPASGSEVQPAVVAAMPSVGPDLLALQSPPSTAAHEAAETIAAPSASLPAAAVAAVAKDLRAESVPAAAAPGREPGVTDLPQSAPASVATADAVSVAPSSLGPPELAAREAPLTLALAQPDTMQTSDDREDLEAVRRAARFIGDYDGGPCVFVAAVRLAGGVADVDGFAVAAEPFGQFNQGFAAVAGFEPAVTGQKVWSTQCPAVDFLRRLHGAGDPPPTLRLESVSVQAGGSLHGTIEDAARRALHLVLVSETGAVQDLSASLVPSDGGSSFTLAASGGHAAGPVPELLVAVAGDTAPPGPTADGMTAATFFDAWATAAARRGAPLSAAAKLFLRRD